MQENKPAAQIAARHNTPGTLTLEARYVVSHNTTEARMEEYIRQLNEQKTRGKSK